MMAELSQVVVLCLAQAFEEVERAPAQPSLLVQMLPILILFVLFYFVLIRPQLKKQKEHEKLISSVKSGDRVIAAGGIFGTITNVKEDRVVLKVAENVKIEVQRASIIAVERAKETKES